MTEKEINKRVKLLERRMKLRAAADQYEIGTKACTKAWKRFHRVDRKLYKLDHREWSKQWMPLCKEWAPYGAFAYIPNVMIAMVERCYIYWTHGYNVHVVEEEVAPIRESVTIAHNMALKLQQMGDNIDTADDYAEYLKLQQEFFTYVGAHCDTWDD